MKRKEPTVQVYRQGDVLLVRRAGIPVAACEEEPVEGRVVLARGEHSGHAHVMPADRVCRFRDDGTGGSYVRIRGSEPAPLSHEEHATLAIPPGDYEVVQQREYQPRETARTVVD